MRAARSGAWPRPCAGTRARKTRSSAPRSASRPARSAIADRVHLPTRLVERNGALHAILTGADGAERALRIENAPAAYTAYRDRPVSLGIRPEAITDPEGADRNARNIQPLANVVGVTEPAGSDTFVTMTLSGKDCIARMRADADVHPGQSFDFAVNMDKAVLFDPETEERII